MGRGAPGAHPICHNIDEKHALQHGSKTAATAAASQFPKPARRRPCLTTRASQSFATLPRWLGRSSPTTPARRPAPHKKKGTSKYIILRGEGGPQDKATGAHPRAPSTGLFFSPP